MARPFKRCLARRWARHANHPCAVWPFCHMPMRSLQSIVNRTLFWSRWGCSEFNTGATWRSCAWCPPSVRGTKKGGTKKGTFCLSDKAQCPLLRPPAYQIKHNVPFCDPVFCGAARSTTSIRRICGRRIATSTRPRTVAATLVFVSPGLRSGFWCVCFSFCGFEIYPFTRDPRSGAREFEIMLFVASLSTEPPP